MGCSPSVELLWFGLGQTLVEQDHRGSRTETLTLVCLVAYGACRSSCYLSDAVALFSPGFCSGFCHLAPHEHAVLRLIVIIFGSSSGTPQHLHSIRCECSAQSWKITARSKSGHNNPRTFLIMELYQGSTNRKHVGTPRRAWVSSLPTNHISPWQRRGVGLLLGYT